MKRLAGPAHAKADLLKPDENRHVKAVRTGFTMTPEDYRLLVDLQRSLLSQRIVAPKSQILRAALHALNALDTVDCLKILNALPQLKQGRPAKQRSSREKVGT